MFLPRSIPGRYAVIELRHLRYVLAVAEEGNISRAAERLGIRQPPLTRQIRLLEAELGVALFQRLPRGVRVTEAGRAFVEEAAAVVARAARLPETARRAARGERGRIGVGFTSSSAFHPFVTRAIRAFRQERPGVLIELEEGSTGELVSALQEEHLDAAFIRSSKADAAGLRIEPLLAEAMVAALPAGHALARGERIALAALAGETFVLYRRPAGPGLYDAIIAACHAAGFNPEIGQEAPRLPSTLSLVAAGLGVSIVPASMRRLDSDGVAYLELDGCPELVAPLLLATRRSDRSIILRHFREQVKNGARRSAPPSGSADPR